jgi:thiamine biosynthesis protein ThiI
MKCVGLLSSGIDSPVACYSISHCVDSFILMHADNRPFTDKRESTNTIRIAKKIDEIVHSSVTLYLVSHGIMLDYLLNTTPKRYRCVLCKRMMVRYADKICEKVSADAIVMGDSLGQVASQTLQNIRVVNEVATYPVLRPLIGFDKEEIIATAKKIDMFNLSILPSASCTAVPKKPATSAKIDRIREIEQSLSFGNLVDELIDNITIVKSEDFDSFIDL